MRDLERLQQTVNGVDYVIHAAAWEWGAYLGEDNLKNGLRIHALSYTRHHVNNSMAKAKASVLVVVVSTIYNSE